MLPSKPAKKSTKKVSTKKAAAPDAAIHVDGQGRKIIRIDINERSHFYKDPTYIVVAENRQEAIAKAVAEHLKLHPKQAIDDLRVVSERDAHFVA